MRMLFHSVFLTWDSRGLDGRCQFSGSSWEKWTCARGSNYLSHHRRRPATRCACTRPCTIVFFFLHFWIVEREMFLSMLNFDAEFRWGLKAHLWMSGMETGTALSRAMTYVMQRNSDPNQQRIDAINMSYGEYSHFSSSGRVGELMAQVINKVGSLSHTIKGLGELAKLVG